MKKFFTIMLLAVFAFVAFSCEDRNDDIDNDTYAVMTDVTGSFNAANNYTLDQGINIAATDVVLVYRNRNSGNGGTTAWQLIPKTEFMGSGRELDYNFLFDAQNVEIYTEANFDQATLTGAEANTYLNNQRFRIVLVPASQGKNANVDFSDYNAVLRHFQIADRP